MTLHTSDDSLTTQNPGSLAVAVRSLVFVLALTLCSCQATRYRTSEQVAAACTITEDQFKGTRTIRTPWFQGNEERSGGGPLTYFVRHVDSGVGTKGVSQIYVRYLALEWSFLHSAYLPGRRRLPVTRIDTSAGSTIVGRGVGVTEDLAITIDDTVREAALGRNEGFLPIRLYGKKSNWTLNVAPLVVRGFLQALSENAAAPAPR